MIGSLIYLRNKKINHQWNIPSGHIIYADILHPEQTIHSKSFCLGGKPDYIVKTTQGEIVPVEVKTGYHVSPKPWHIMQLIAYCHIVSDQYEHPVSYGILVYYDTKKQFRIPYTKKYQNLLTSTIEQMYDPLVGRMVHQTQIDVSRCSHCSYHQVCPEYNNVKTC